MSSVLQNIGDINLVDNFILIDDSSCASDRAFMRDWCAINIKIPTEIIEHEIKGNAYSINLLYKKMYEENTEYSLFLEDDWLWTVKDNYIQKAYILLNSIPDVAQVCYTTYTHFDDKKNPYRLLGRCYRGEVYNGIRFCRSHIDNWTTSPHLMSFRNVYEKVGEYPIVSGRLHELSYRNRYHAANFKMIFLDENIVDNIAEVSAYTLNE
jgi:hypothetical protein